jgi:hypothetical protein
MTNNGTSGFPAAADNAARSLWLLHVRRAPVVQLAAAYKQPV